MDGFLTVWVVSTSGGTGGVRATSKVNTWFGWRVKMKKFKWTSIKHIGIPKSFAGVLCSVDRSKYHVLQAIETLGSEEAYWLLRALFHREEFNSSSHLFLRGFLRSCYIMQLSFTWQRKEAYLLFRLYHWPQKAIRPVQLPGTFACLCWSNHDRI